jgi:hypothetical protein
VCSPSSRRCCSRTVRTAFRRAVRGRLPCRSALGWLAFAALAHRLLLAAAEKDWAQVQARTRPGTGETAGRVWLDRVGRAAAMGWGGRGTSGRGDAVQALLQSNARVDAADSAGCDPARELSPSACSVEHSRRADRMTRRASG